MLIQRIPIWKKAPFIRLLIPFILGLITSKAGFFPIGLIWCCIFIIIVLFCWNKIPLTWRFRFFHFPGLLINVLLFCLGGGIFKTHSHNTHLLANKLKNPSKGQLLLHLEKVPDDKNTNYRFPVTVKGYINQDSLFPLKGKLLIYLKKEKGTIAPTPGSFFIIKALPTPIRNSGNPGSFDAVSYWERKGITHQVFLNKNSYLETTTNNLNYFTALFQQWRKYLLLQLKQYIPNPRAAGLAEALMIGYKSDLDPELTQTFANTGVIHVIAISGLHLGLIFVLLKLLVKPLPIHNRHWLPTIIIIIGLWTFAFLTGASPSVLRAALMFTVILFSNLFVRQAGIYHSLSLSAFILLCIQPYWLWETGFQLSYLAVLGIVLFQSPIAKCFNLSNPILHYAWNLFCVTLAAQVLTTPIAQFYFGQFPNYCWLANLLVVPLAGLLLPACLLLCAVSAFPFIASPLGQLLSWVFSFVCSILEKIEQLPGALTHYYPNPLQVALAYLLVFFAACWLLGKRKSLSWFAMGVFLVLTLVTVIKNNTRYRQNLGVVYHQKGHSCIDWFKGQKGRYFSENPAVQPPFASFQSRKFLGFREMLPFTSFDSLSTFSGIKFGILGKAINFSAICSSNALNPDVLLLSGNPTINLSEFPKNLQPKLWVADGSNSFKKVLEWRQQAKRLNLPFHSTYHEGCLVIPANY